MKAKLLQFLNVATPMHITWIIKRNKPMTALKKPYLLYKTVRSRRKQLEIESSAG